MINETKAAELEAAIRELTRPINGQYPRPWLTNSKDPASSKVFVVGMNDAKTFRVEDVGSTDRFIDAHFNRDVEGCYDLFYLVTSCPYYTRNNIDDFIRRLEKHGILKRPMPPLPTKSSSEPAEVNLGKLSVFVIPSFAPPELNKWSSWRNKHLEDVCRAVATRLGRAASVH